MFSYKTTSEKKEYTSNQLSVIINEIENLTNFGNGTFVIGTVYQSNTLILKFSVNANGVMWFAV